MNKKEILALIEIVYVELEKVVESTIFSKNDNAIQETIKVMGLLANELHHITINERVLRAMHDIGMSAYKDFENTRVEKALNDLIEELYDSIPVYKYLKPLRNEFGKGIPI